MHRVICWTAQAACSDPDLVRIHEQIARLKHDESAERHRIETDEERIQHWNAICKGSRRGIGH